MIRMTPSQILPQHRAAIRRMVSNSGMSNPRFFGSFVHGDASEDSDLDILVDPSPESSLLDLGKLQIELESVVGMKVDLRTPRSLPESFRERILAEAVSI
ncbi:MAG TPA: nucleotidyltransferase family protein [Terracidiphilus sp.]|nr:nucleotidyltransferase family protein [Terracidiphilus sp.]